MNIFLDLIIRTPALPQFKGVNMLKLYKHWIKVHRQSACGTYSTGSSGCTM